MLLVPRPDATAPVRGFLMAQLAGLLVYVDVVEHILDLVGVEKLEDHLFQMDGLHIPKGTARLQSPPRTTSGKSHAKVNRRMFVKPGPGMRDRWGG